MSLFFKTDSEIRDQQSLDELGLEDSLLDNTRISTPNEKRR